MYIDPSVYENAHAPTMPLSDLLPIKRAANKPAAILKALNEYSLLLKSAKETIVALKSRNFEVFDPLVGDNFCQGRAARIAITFRSCLASLEAKESLVEERLQRIQGIFDRETQWTKENKQSFEELLADGLDMHFSDDETFFIESHVLTQVRVNNQKVDPDQHSETIDARRLTGIKPLSTQFCQAMVKNLKRKLSDETVEFAKKLARKDGFTDELSIFEDSKICTGSKVKCLPFFKGTEFLLRQAQFHQVPLILWTQQLDNEERKHIRDVCLYYMPVGGGGYIEILPRNDCSFIREPAIVVKGVAIKEKDQLLSKQRWRNKLKPFHPAALVKANSAAHRQFPDETTSDKVESDPEYHSYKAFAEAVGCTRDNPSLFMVTHVFCQAAIHLEPFKYILNKHLSPYLTFYIEQAHHKVKQTALEISPNAAVEMEDSKIVVKGLSEQQREELKRRVDREYFFRVDVVADKADGEELAFVVKEVDSYRDAATIIPTSRTKSSPGCFLIDHFAFWSYKAEEALEVCMSDPKVLEHPEYLDCLIEVVKEDGYDKRTQTKAIECVAMCLDVPALREKAKAALIDFATSDALYVDYIKLHAVKQLAYLAGEPDVKTLLTEQAQEEKAIEVRIAALNALDGVPDGGKIVQDLQLKKCLEQLMDVEKVDNQCLRDMMALDYLLWDKREAASRVIKEIGEHALVDKLMGFYRQGKRFFPYSYLKLIARHTQDQALFDTITDFLIDMCDGVIFGNIEPLNNVLQGLAHHSSLRFNERANRYMAEADPVNSMSWSPAGSVSAFSRLPRRSDESKAKSLNLLALTKMLYFQSETTQKRKLAIRESVLFTLFQGQPYWNHHIRKQWLQEHVVHIKPLIDCLNFIMQEDPDAEIREEAARAHSMQMHIWQDFEGGNPSNQSEPATSFAQSR